MFKAQEADRLKSKVGTARPKNRNRSVEVWEVFSLVVVSVSLKESLDLT